MNSVAYKTVEGAISKHQCHRVDCQGVSTAPNESSGGKSNGPAVTNRLAPPHRQILRQCPLRRLHLTIYSARCHIVAESRSLSINSHPSASQACLSMTMRIPRMSCFSRQSLATDVTTESARKTSTRSLGLSRMIVDRVALTLRRDQNRNARCVRRGRCSIQSEDPQSSQLFTISRWVRSTKSGWFSTMDCEWLGERMDLRLMDRKLSGRADEVSRIGQRKDPENEAF